MGIFKNNAEKYFDLGIPVIPLGGKIPKISGWQEWCSREQTINEVDYLVDNYPKSNIGAPLGTWAIALDIDADDAEVERACPYSPLRRVGKKGFVLFFHKDSEIKNTPQTQYPVEVLAAGRQVVLPPSIHPESKQEYRWDCVEDIFQFDLNELPKLTAAQLEQIFKVCERRKIYSKKRIVDLGDPNNRAVLTDVGRHNRLIKISYAMACNLKPEDEAVKELIELDKKEHEIPWFSDKTEPHGGKNPEDIARKMFQRAVKAATKRGDLLPVGELDLSALKVLAPAAKASTAFPAPRGIMKLFVDYCELTSVGRQDRLGLGGAISLMSGICSNRFRTILNGYDVWPNTYVINLAHSGFGKETSQRALRRLLFDSGLIGSAAYKSGSSIVMGLPEQQERIDIIDECSALLKSMTSKDDYKAEIVEILSQLFSASSDHYLGMTSVGSGKGFGATWNPCVNILGSTTPQGFRSSVSRDMAAKGLLPRFMLFWQKDVGEFKELNARSADTVFQELRKCVRKILSIPKPVHHESTQENLLEPNGIDKTVRYDPILIPASNGAEKLFKELSRKYFDEGKRDGESFESAFKNRFTQNTAKLSLLDTVSQGFDEISVDSLEWAHDVIKAQWDESRELYELASAENKNHEDILRCMNIIRKNPYMSKSAFYLATRWLNKRQRTDIINELVETGFITLEQSPLNKRSLFLRMLTH